MKFDKNLSNAGVRYLDSLTFKTYVDIISGVVVSVALIIAFVYVANCVKVILP